MSYGGWEAALRRREGRRGGGEGHVMKRWCNGKMIQTKSESKSEAALHRNADKRATDPSFRAHGNLSVRATVVSCGVWRSRSCSGSVRLSGWLGGAEPHSAATLLQKGACLLVKCYHVGFFLFFLLFQAKNKGARRLS